MRPWLLGAVGVLVACREGTAPPPTTVTVTTTVTTTTTVPAPRTVVWTCWADDDGDGHGDPARPGPCDSGTATDALDCDDTDPSRGGGPELPYTGRDEDCSEVTPDDDLDGDGFLLADDCDDTDPRTGGPEVPYDGLDNDCDPATLDDDLDGDGVGGASDCDDADPARGAAALDADCDGVTTADDCDDTDPAAPDRRDDEDCDGAPTGDDCDDTDPAQGAFADDADCDGAPTADDCDDLDDTVGSRADDADCDRLLADDDCDDTDPLAPDRRDDADCDGVATGADCDDGNPAFGDVGGDADCDGVQTAQDCDDLDATLGARADDADCDGILTALDCDDDDDDIGGTATDADCDGILDDDLREGDVTFLSPVAEDFPEAIRGHGHVDGDGLADLLLVDRTSHTGGHTGAVYVVPGATAAALGGDHRVDEVAAWSLVADTADQLLDAAWVDDIDGDGADDLWVVASEVSGDPVGAALYVASSDLGPGGSLLLSTVSSLSLTTTPRPDQGFESLARVGDIDGDGLGEALVALRGLGLSSQGEVQVVMSTGMGTGAPARHRLFGPTARSESGLGVMTDLGDIDGDGLSDVAVGAPGWGGDRQGQLYVVFGDQIAATPDFWLGDAQASLVGNDRNDELGRAEVAAVPDLDGDGTRDLLVGDYANDQLVMVRGSDLGGFRVPLVDVAYTTVSAATGDWFGWQVDPIDDLDGDGLREVAVSAPENEDAGDPDAGALWVIEGAVLGAGGAFDADDGDARYAAGGRAGDQVAAVGDVDGDGVGDLLVTAPESDGGGSAALFWGAGLLP